MSYRDFTLQDVKHRLGVRLIEDEAIHDRGLDVAPGAPFAEWLHSALSYAVAINTEKARSEMIIAPLLLEVQRMFGNRYGFFSGREFNVDPARGLVGVCDFLLSLSPERYEIEAPLIAVVEAKNLDVARGLPQCLAEMVAIQMFNEQHKARIETVHGVVSTGTLWRFLRLTGATAWIDTVEYHINELPKILGVFKQIVRHAQQSSGEVLPLCPDGAR